jgi:ABC-type amino acid transport substrate-binding protein
MLLNKIIFFKALAIFHLFFSLHCQSEDKTIHAAVAEGFIDGLHSKYLEYIADKLSMPISITTIPFARRIKEIEIGRLDIIVGLQQTEERKDKFVYIYPSYESLSYRFFR